MSDALQSSAESRRCHACGTRVRTDARFCGNCGVRLPAPSELDAPSLVGTTVAGAYQVEGVLGTGSMGVVYRAEQLALRRKVALKVIGESADDDTTRARFRREARAASQINHPNVVQVYDFGQLPGGQPYLAMELLKGQTLEQLIDSEFPLELSRVVRIQIDILTALQAAHDLGILHRDLKPANVFISELPSGQEVAKVLDFGIATAMDSSLTGTQTWAPLTEAGFVCGTPAFMSPEQVQGFPLDQRSDLFSAAGLLYQMMTKERPFKGKSPVEVGANIVLRPLVPPSRSRSELDLTDVLDDFLLQAMAKQPDDRFASAEEMIEQLRVLLTALEGDSGRDAPDTHNDEVPETNEWPESHAEDEYPDTVVNQEAVTSSERAAKKLLSGATSAARKPSRAPLPTPFADIDPTRLTPPSGAYERAKLMAAAREAERPRPSRPLRTPAPRQRPTFGRPTHSEAEADTQDATPVAGQPHTDAIGTTGDEVKEFRRSGVNWLPWLLLMVLAASIVAWLIFFSPWVSEVR